MGMIPFLLIAAAEKRRRDEAAAASRRRASQEKSKKQNSSSYSYSRSYSSMDKPYIISLIKELKYENPELLKFFKELDLAVDEAIVQRSEESTKRILECIELYKKHLKQLEITRGKLLKAGIVVTNPDRSSYALHLNAKEACDQGIYYVNLRPAFNGIDVPRSMASNPQDDTYRSKYEKIHSNNEPLDEEERIAKEGLLAAQKKLSHAILKRTKESLQSSIDGYKDDLMHVKTRREMEAEARRKAEFVESLTPEQRKLIEEYYTVAETIEKLAKLINEHSHQRENLQKSRSSKETIVLASEILRKKKNLSEEDIKRVFEQLDKVAIKRHRGEYDVNSYSTAEWEVEKMKPMLEGFIKHVYEADPEFTERNAWEITEGEPDDQEH